MANKEGQGVLFLNTQKNNDKSPDYSGSINFNGKEIKISGWSKEALSGAKYISLAVNNFKKEEPKKEAPKNEIEDDEIPWS